MVAIRICNAVIRENEASAAAGADAASHTLWLQPMQKSLLVLCVGLEDPWFASPIRIFETRGKGGMILAAACWGQSGEHSYLGTLCRFATKRI